jgi:tripartite-type tricarboxylate transporter receptor subunit TctC
VPALPDVPTFRELGVEVDPAYAWMAMSIAAATPAPVVARLNTELNQAIATEEVARIIGNLSAEAVPGDAAAFNAMVRAESALWRPLIRELGIRLDQ